MAAALTRFLRRTIWRLPIVLPAAACIVANPLRAAETPRHEIAAFRKPIALAWADGGRTLVVANRRSGSLSLVDVETRAVRDEFAVSDRLAALVALGDGERFAAVDDKRNELLLLRCAGGRVEVVARTATGRDPACVAASDDGAFVAVACRWSRRLELFTVADRRPPAQPTPSDDRGDEPPAKWNAAILQVARTWPLPFAPREVLFLPGGERIVATDAFGGGLATADRRRGDDAVRSFHVDGYDLRGLSHDAERRELVFTYQRLAERLPTTVENIRDGRLIENRLRRIHVEELLKANGASPAGRDVQLDGNRQGAADPQAAAFAADGRMLIALGGSQQLALLDADGATMRRVMVGMRPSAVAVDRRSRFAYVADQLDDAVSVVDLEQAATIKRIALGPRSEPYPRDRGERLFFDARLSPGGFVSCHSCHTDGHANGLLADTLGDGTYGTPKRVLSLMGTALTDHWAWSGELRELRDQVRRSFEQTMHATSLTSAEHDDVVAFLHTLPFPAAPEPPPDDAPDHAADRRLWERGRTIFARSGCAQCHVPPLTYTSQPAYDVGLRDERGMAKFNPPSLRGVGQNAALFHDNRATSLEAVFRDEQHQLDESLSDADVRALVRFLRSL